MALRKPDIRIEPADDPNWVTIDEAAAVTGDNVRTLRWRCANVWRREGRALQAPPRGGGRPIWWICRPADPRLARFPTGDVRDEHQRPTLLDRHPLNYVERAYRRAYWLSKWNAARNGPRAVGVNQHRITDDICAEARRVEGETFRINARSLQLWHAAYHTRVDGVIVGVAALVDGYRPTGPAQRSDEAIEYFRSMHRTENKLSVRECHRFTCAAAAKHGWQWPAGYASTLRWLTDTDDREAAAVSRQGYKAWSHEYMAHLRSDWSLLSPGQLYVCDHKRCDFWVRYNGQIIRPWLTAVQDCASRMIVGWRLGPAPHTDAILAAMRMAFSRYAVPEAMRIDNGKDFTSQAITGLTKAEHRAFKRLYGKDWRSFFDRFKRDGEFADGKDRAWLGLLPELGIQTIFAIPYHAWSKGTLERWFRTMDEQCGKHFVTWGGAKTQERPEALAAILEGRVPLGDASVPLAGTIDPSLVPTLEFARERVGDFIEHRYHAQGHTGHGMYGRSPREVWATASSLRRADDDAIAMLTRVRGAYKVGPNGVTITAFGGSVTYAGGGALNNYKGRKVLVAVDYDAPGQAWAFDVDSRRLIARLATEQRIHPLADGETLREAFAAKRRDAKVGEQARRTSARRTRTMAQRINEMKQSELVARRATGTDDRSSLSVTQAIPSQEGVTVVPVSTGFEAASSSVRAYVEVPSVDPYAHLSVSDLVAREQHTSREAQCTSREAQCTSRERDQHTSREAQCTSRERERAVCDPGATVGLADGADDFYDRLVIDHGADHSALIPGCRLHDDEEDES